MSYDKNTDYSLLIEKAAAGGDYVKAAHLEAARNEKIDSEKLNYEKTNKYSGWLDSTDYGTVLKNQMNAGASKSAVAQTLTKRVKKAVNTEGLQQYTYDDIFDSAMKYLQEEEPGFSYKESRPEYTDKYSDFIKRQIDELFSKKPFSYSPYDDELYGYYKDAYSRQGRRAMEDTLGTLAANTGGVASSYAANAASQSYDYYNMKTAEKIPELYSLAYGEYLDAIQRDIEGIGMLDKLSNEQYDRFSDKAKAYEADRDFSYDIFSDKADRNYLRDKLGRDIFESDRDYFFDAFNKNRDFGYDVYESNRDFENELNEFAQSLSFEKEKLQSDNRMEEIELAQKIEQSEFNRALERWQAMGYLDKAGSEILGIPEGTKTSDYQYKEAQMYKLYR